MQRSCESGGARVRILLIGATGGTGQAVLAQALARGHHITAIVRQPQSVTPSDSLSVVEGNALRAEDVARAADGADAVISVLGQRRASDRTVLEEGARAAVAALARAGVRRYIIVSQGLLYHTTNPIVLLIRWFLRRTVADSTRMEQVVAASELDWTIVRPPKLSNGNARRGYRSARNSMPRGAWSMQRADLATFLLDEAEQGAHPRTIVGVG